MPTVPTYITDEDFVKYLEVKKKGKSSWTEFIHDALNHKLPYESDAYMNPWRGPRKRDEKSITGELVEIDESQIKRNPGILPKEPREITVDKKDTYPIARVGPLCKHNKLPGQCPYKGCVNHK